ncbi:MAG TPA: diacylglycerol kinase family protein [Gemmatimonadales bacterium]
MTQALLITNPVAARTDARAVRVVLDTLRGGGWTVDVLATTRPGDARRFAEEARGQGFDVVVSYGGDGTAIQVAAGLLGSGIPLGLVPGGTGNLLAGNLRLPRNPAAAARALLRGEPRPVDLGVIERADGPHYFAVAAGAGFDAELMARTLAPDKHRWKMGAYVARAIRMLPAVASAPHRVTVDGRAHEISAAMLMVVNCGEIMPPFFKLHAEVAPDDGWLDVVALRADGPLDGARAFLELMVAARRSAPDRGNGDRRTWFARGKTVRVEVLDGGERPVQLDGEATGETPFEARLLPAALTVLAAPNVVSQPRAPA